MPQSRSRVPLVVSIFLVLMLTGCFGMSGDDEVPDRGPQEDETPSNMDRENDRPSPSAPDNQTVWFRFPLDRPVQEEMWVNGSFGAEETGLGGGFVTGEFQQEVDLSALVPAEVPTRLQVRVVMDAMEMPLAGPTARADPTSNATVWYESSWRNPEPGLFEMDGVVKRSEDGTVGLLLEAYVPGPEEPPGLEFSVHATASARPQAIPDRVPVAVHLEGNETIRVQSDSDDHAELLIYTPDDRLVGRLFFFGEDRWTVPGQRGGEFVLMPIVGSGQLRIGVETPVKEGEEIDEPGTIRALGFRRETGEPRDVEPYGTVDWEFDVDRSPLRVLLTLSGPSGEPWICYGVARVQLSSPEDRVLERSVECPSPTNVPFLYEEVWTWGPALGDESLVAGTYQAGVEADLLHGHTVTHTVEWYER